MGICLGMGAGGVLRIAAFAGMTERKANRGSLEAGKGEDASGHEGIKTEFISSGVI